MKVREARSDCPINYALEIIGDKWSLLVIRDMAFFGKTSYGEFLSADEKIATNILSNRLGILEASGIINKVQDTTNKTKFIYSLAQPGLDLIPLIIDMLVWSTKQRPVKGGPDAILAKMAHENRQQLIDAVQLHLQAGNKQPFIQTLL